MIEVAGSRYALGRRTARSARLLMKLIEVSYALFLLHGVLLLGGWPHGLVISVLYLFLTALTPVTCVLYLLTQTFNGADRQQIEPTPPPSPIWLGAALFGLQVSLLFVGRYLGAGRYGAAACIVAALMIWHIRACRAMTCRITQTAQLGGGEPYAMFDWDQFDSSADGLFRARFGSRSDWKAPRLITHPVEADRYARRTRQRRLSNMAATAGSALTALVFAQQVLSEVLRSTWHDLAHVIDASPRPATGFAYICSIQVATALFLLPIFFQYLASEMDALAKLYEDRCALLLDH
jgi:hypothetical protein